MRVKSASVANKSKKEIDIKISNGHREFMVEIFKENITLEQILDEDVVVKVYSLIRTCCASCPKYVLESGKSKEDNEEIKQLLKDIYDILYAGMEK